MIFWGLVFLLRIFMSRRPTQKSAAETAWGLLFAPVFFHGPCTEKDEKAEYQAYDRRQPHSTEGGDAKNARPVRFVINRDSVSSVKI